MSRNSPSIPLLTLLALLALMAYPVPAAAADSGQLEKQRTEIRTMADETLARLYKTQPALKKTIAKASGYAVFSNFGMKILFAGGGKGKGLAVDNKSKKEIYMKMVELQAGLGMGIKKFRLVWVFEYKKDLDSFINSGWEFGGQGTAAAQAGGQGESFAGAISVSPGVWLYQLTDDGLALELTAKGTKYYKDDELN